MGDTTPAGEEGERRGTLVVRALRALWRPSALPFGVLAVAGFIAGVLAWGGFHWAVELSNTESFCIGCHEMRDTVYQELQRTVHFTNASGVRATCPDCHVPKEWLHKLVRKVRATNELYHTIVGSVDTKEKFEAKRFELARNVWAALEATDSRECRNCHATVFMDMSKQWGGAQRNHEIGIEQGLTCINCHQGIAHELPAGFTRPVY